MASNCASLSKVTWHNPLFSSFKTASNMSLASSHRASLGFFFFFKKNNTYLIIFTKMSLFLSSYGCYECDFCLWYEINANYLPVAPFKLRKRKQLANNKILKHFALLHLQWGKLCWSTIQPWAILAHIILKENPYK